MTSQSRRSFIKQLVFVTAALPYAGVLGKSFNALAAEKKAVPLPAGQTALPDTDAVAAAIGYHPNAKDTDFTKYPQRKKPSAKNQFCKSCALYTPANEGWGKCQMLVNGLVSANGWCGSWSKKS